MTAPDEARERYYLLGDEDCGVGIYCRDCNHGGRPLAYYAGVSGDWPDETVPTVRRVLLLLAAMGEHEASGVHAAIEQTVSTPRFAAGGYIAPREPSNDMVPAILSPGCHTIRRPGETWVQATERLLGRAPRPRGRHEA